MVGVSYRLRAASPGDMSQGADMFSATVGVTLPIWAKSKQNARMRENAARIDAALASKSDVQLRVRSMLQRSIDELERLASQIELYRNELLPEADEALDASIEDYNTNQVGFVSVLDNWRTTLDLQLMLERLRVRHAQLMAQVEALVGGWSGKAAR
jgi:outer membrane protein TolC